MASDKDSDTDQRTISRRSFLSAGVGGAAVVAAGSLPGSAAAAASMSPGGDVMGPSVNGTVKQVILPDALVLSPFYLDLEQPPAGASMPEGDEVSIKITGDSQLSRIGPAAIDDYRPGDKVIAYVQWDQDGGLVALAVDPLFQAVEEVVTARTGNRLDTDSGSLLISDHTVLVPPGGSPSARSTDEIVAGMKVGASCFFDSENDAWIAGNIAVVS